MLKKLLFPKSPSAGTVNFSLLLLRLGFGLGMALLHGYDKLIHYTDKAAFFNENYFTGALILVVLAEFFCALAVALGFLTRLALIPLLVNMVVAMLAHSGFNELGFVYLLVYFILFITGPGKVSVDKFFA